MRRSFCNRQAIIFKNSPISGFDTAIPFRDVFSYYLISQSDEVVRSGRTEKTVAHYYAGSILGQGPSQCRASILMHFTGKSYDASNWSCSKLTETWRWRLGFWGFWRHAD